MPDSVESRVARVEQRTADHEGDIRAFAEALREMWALQERVAGALVRLAAVELRVAEMARENEERRRLKWTNVVAVVSLVFLAVTTTIGVLTFVVNL